MEGQNGDHEEGISFTRGAGSIAKQATRRGNYLVEVQGEPTRQRRTYLKPWNRTATGCRKLTAAGDSGSQKMS